MPNDDVREKQFNMRLSEQEHAWLKAIAEKYGLSEANAVRFLLKKEADAISEQAPKPAPPKPAKKK